MAEIRDFVTGDMMYETVDPEDVTDEERQREEEEVEAWQQRSGTTRIE
jgi:hypothetical protein